MADLQRRRSKRREDLLASVSAMHAVTAVCAVEVVDTMKTDGRDEYVWKERCNLGAAPGILVALALLQAMFDIVDYDVNRLDQVPELTDRQREAFLKTVRDLFARPTQGNLTAFMRWTRPAFDRVLRLARAWLRRMDNGGSTSERAQLWDKLRAGSLHLPATWDKKDEQVKKKNNNAARRNRNKKRKQQTEASPRATAAATPPPVPAQQTAVPTQEPAAKKPRLDRSPEIVIDRVLPSTSQTKTNAPRKRDSMDEVMGHIRHKYFRDDPHHAADFAKAFHFFEPQMAALAQEMRNIRLTLKVPLYEISVTRPKQSVQTQSSPVASPAAAGAQSAAVESPSPTPKYSPKDVKFFIKEPHLRQIYDALADNYEPTPAANLQRQPPPTPPQSALTPAAAAEYSGEAQAETAPPTQPSPAAEGSSAASLDDTLIISTSPLQNSSAANDDDIGGDNGDSAVIPDSLPPPDVPRTPRKKRKDRALIKTLPPALSPLPITPGTKGEKSKYTIVERGGNPPPSPAF